MNLNRKVRTELQFGSVQARTELATDEPARPRFSGLKPTVHLGLIVGFRANPHGRTTFLDKKFCWKIIRKKLWEKGLVVGNSLTYIVL